MAAPVDKKQKCDDTCVFTGDEGSLAHIAAGQFFRSYPGVDLRGVGSFQEAFKQVSNGTALYGVIPIENSASGSIHCTYDLAVEHDVHIGGELGVREIYCLCTKSKDVSEGDVRNVASHPNVLEACSTFVKSRLYVKDSRTTKSTTEAARLVSEGAKDLAAIATREAAERFGLHVLVENIANDQFLETRYILIYKKGGIAENRPVPFPRDAVSPTKKRCAVFALRNEPGAIYKLLGQWAHRNIDVLKMETRPIPAGQQTAARLWDYYFFVEYNVPPGQTPEAAERLQSALKEFSLWYRDLGAYPSQLSTREEKRAHSWDDMVDMMAKA